MRKSHLASALLLELQDEVGFPSTASDFSRLELHTNPFLEKQMQLLIECIDDLQQESHKMQQHERNLYRQKKQQANKTPAPPDRRRALRDRAPDGRDSFPRLALRATILTPPPPPLPQTDFLLKKKIEAQERERKGEEPRPEEATSTNPLFKPIPAPSRIESLLIANQMQAYCQQINQFTGQSFAKLFLMQSVNAGGE